MLLVGYDKKRGGITDLDSNPESETRKFYFPLNICLVTGIYNMLARKRELRLNQKELPYTGGTEQG